MPKLAHEGKNMSFRGRLCRPWESPGRVLPLHRCLCGRTIVPGDCHVASLLAMTRLWCAALVGASIARPPCLPRFEGGGFAARRRRRELTPPVELPKFGNSTAPSQRGGQDGVLLSYRRGEHCSSACGISHGGNGRPMAAPTMRIGSVRRGRKDPG